MKVLFIRHAAAVDKNEHPGPDMLRPLTEDGKVRARTVFQTLAALYRPPQSIVCSQALRARETADILSECMGHTPVRESDLLNPGADHKKFTKLLHELWETHGQVALVGHEPDFSSIISEAVAEGPMRIDVKKASCVEVEVNRLGKGELKAVLPPAALLQLSRR